MVVNLLIAVYALPVGILTLLSVDEILQPGYLNSSTKHICVQVIEISKNSLEIEFIA